jgi:hypothetical protein
LLGLSIRRTRRKNKAFESTSYVKNPGEGVAQIFAKIQAFQKKIPRRVPYFGINNNIISDAIKPLVFYYSR